MVIIVDGFDVDPWTKSKVIGHWCPTFLSIGLIQANIGDKMSWRAHFPFEKKNMSIIPPF
jgi:hypothetical protein